MIRLPSFFESPHALLGMDTKEGILVGLSGGKDSVALLHILCDYAKNVGCKLYAAHINHGIRTDNYNNEAQRDEDFCSRLCKKLDIPLFIKRLDIPTLAKNAKVSVEGCARDERYKFFSSVMRENNVKILALAHNANDNLETQIFNLCRGSSVLGIEGIKKTRKIQGIDGYVVRPLLLATTQEIIDYCKKNSLEYVTDSTNFELDATRNKIRHRVIPELEAIFSSCANSSGRLSLLAGEQNDFISLEAEKFISGHLVRIDGGYSMPIIEFSNLHVALRRTVISDVFKKLDISLEFTHIDAAINLIYKAVPHSAIDLPKGAVIKIEDGQILALKFDTKEKNHFFDVPLHMGFNVINDSFAIGLYDEKNCEEFVESVYTLYTYSVAKCDKIKCMHARQRISGDIITDGGNHKSVKKLLCDKKIPLTTRDLLPIVCCGEEIIYIPLCALSDSAKVRENGSYVKICIYKKGK